VRVLPDVVGVKRGGRVRRLVAAGTVVAAAVVLAGCSQFDAALDQRQAIVTFTDNATVTQRLAVRAACSKTPNVTAQALPSTLNTYTLQQVAYTVTNASDADIALLNECLNRYPKVVEGMTLQDASDEGD
jgi:hypothetical protein